MYAYTQRMCWATNDDFWAFFKHSGFGAKIAEVAGASSVRLVTDYLMIDPKQGACYTCAWPVLVHLDVYPHGIGSRLP